MMAEVPLFPPLVAVIVVDPAATAVTRPVAETVATPVALLDHVMVRPVNTLPAESLVTALSWRVVPTRSVALEGVTVTEATGTTVTVIAARPFFPSLVAVIVAAPAASAVTRPLAETVATPGALLDHVTVRPINTLPAESFVVTLSCTLAPTRTAADAGATVTEATGPTVTDTVAVPLFPSLVAVIVAAPAAMAETRPLAETLAMPGALLDHVTTRPLKRLFAESLVVAAS